jgi:hypothetical protein
VLVPAFANFTLALVAAAETGAAGSATAARERIRARDKKIPKVLPLIVFVFMFFISPPDLVGKLYVGTGF